jgi:hypothetical protein
MFDGLVGCFGAHDGRHADRIRPHLAAFGPTETIWQQLLDSSTTILGMRRLRLSPASVG